MGDEKPCFGAFDGFLPVLGQSAASSEPCEGAFYDPSSGQDFEALGGVGPLDDFHGPGADFGQGSAQFWPRVSAVGEDMTQPRKAVADGFEHLRRASRSWIWAP